jgi:hypothetical protein
LSAATFDWTLAVCHDLFVRMIFRTNVVTNTFVDWALVNWVGTIAYQLFTLCTVGHWSWFADC